MVRYEQLSIGHILLGGQINHLLSAQIRYSTLHCYFSGKRHMSLNCISGRPVTVKVAKPTPLLAMQGFIIRGRQKAKRYLREKLNKLMATGAPVGSGRNTILEKQITAKAERHTKQSAFNDVRLGRATAWFPSGIHRRRRRILKRSSMHQSQRNDGLDFAAPHVHAAPKPHNNPPAAGLQPLARCV